METTEHKYLVYALLANKHEMYKEPVRALTEEEGHFLELATRLENDKGKMLLVRMAKAAKEADLTAKKSGGNLLARIARWVTE